MEFVISFFRDFLSGPLYIVVAIVSVIGILACIGYLAEKQLKAKEEKKKLDEMYAQVHLLPTDVATGAETVTNVQTVFPSVQLESVGQGGASNVAQNVAAAPQPTAIYNTPAIEVPTVTLIESTESVGQTTVDPTSEGTVILEANKPEVVSTSIDNQPTATAISAVPTIIPVVPESEEPIEQLEVTDASTSTNQTQ